MIFQSKLSKTGIIQRKIQSNKKLFIQYENDEWMIGVIESNLKVYT